MKPRLGGVSSLFHRKNCGTCSQYRFFSLSRQTPVSIKTFPNLDIGYFDWPKCTVLISPEGGSAACLLPALGADKRSASAKIQEEGPFWIGSMSLREGSRSVRCATFEAPMPILH
jgi:hypothetical protein